jgi:uncharacterized membrane protein
MTGDATARLAGTATGCRPTITKLPDLGYGGTASAISGDTVVGSVFDASGVRDPAVWKNGRLTTIGLDHGNAFDINQAGEIAGTAASFTDPFAVVYGAVQSLPYSGGFAWARRINVWGQVAGIAFDGNYAARWNSYRTEPVALQPVPGDAFSSARGINDLGQVAGDTDDENFVPRPAIWSLAGAIRTLPSAFGSDQPGDLFAINDVGMSTGESYLEDGAGAIAAQQATRWSLSGAPTLVPFLPGTNASTGNDINLQGWVSGTASAIDYSTFDASAEHALLWLGHGQAETLPVPGLTYDNSESSIQQVADNGTAVGNSGRVGGPDAATVWTCAQAQAYTPDRADLTPPTAKAPTTNPTPTGRIAVRSEWRRLRLRAGTAGNRP